jgi:hypothetical protein
MATKKAEPKKRGKQTRLPGTEDAALADLDTIGFEYAAIRDKRMELTTQEVELKRRALEAMHKHNRSHYKYQDLEMEIVPGDEKVRVVVKKPKPGKEDGGNDGTKG